LTGLFREIEVVGIYSRTRERAKAQQEKFGLPKLYATLEEMLNDPETSIVLNLTPPQEHFETCMKCLEAGKHVYTEKALAATLEQGRTLIEAAKSRGLTLCGAPDLFLSAGPQTMRKVLDDGMIGKVTGASVTMLHVGHETWHANPEFFYKPGAGPMLDMGVYPITVLVNLLGSVESVAGMCSMAFPERIISTKPRFGTKISVETPTHVAGVLRFESGVIATVTTSYDACSKAPNNLEIYGTRGLLKTSAYNGPVSFFQPDKGEYRELPMLFAYADKIHGVGLADQASAIEKGRRPRASGELMLHVLEVMTAFERSSNTSAFARIESRVERPVPMVYPVLPFVLD
jgi:predicted dehydrogenase